MADTPISSLAELTAFNYNKTPIMVPVVDTADTTMSSTGTTKKANIISLINGSFKKSSTAVLVPVTTNTSATLTNAPTLTFVQSLNIASYQINCANTPLTFTTNNDMAIRLAFPPLYSFAINYYNLSKGYLYFGNSNQTIDITWPITTTIYAHQIEFAPLLNPGTDYPQYFGLRLLYMGSEITFKANQTINISSGTIAGSFPCSNVSYN